MNTPKKRKRAPTPSETPARTGPDFTTSPISDRVGAYIGQVITEYTRLEKAMLGVFRVILGIESGSAAILVYYALKAPKVRWEIARAVLEKDNMHTDTPHSYDEIIEEFGFLTDFRNDCAHSLWEMDINNQPWVTRMREPMDTIAPRKFPKSDFDQMLDRMTALRGKIITVSRKDRMILDERWLARIRQARDSSPSAHQTGE